MDPKIIQALDEFVARFGSDLLPRLKNIETQGQNLAHELEKLGNVREDPEYHGDVSTFEHSLEVVGLLQKIYSFMYKQEHDEKLNITALENALSALPFKLGEHLDNRVGKHRRKELLFFACIFHDLGKLKNFTHMMREVEKENVKGIKRFLFHADFGRLYFEDEMTAIDESIKHYEEKLATEQQTPIKKQFYEQVMAYFKELKETFESRKEFFEKLELGSEERKYIAFVIKNHMDLLNFYRQFSDAYKARESKEGPKLTANFVKNIIKKVDEYDEHYVDCMLLNFCDMLEATHSTGQKTEEMYLFFQSCMGIYANAVTLKGGGKMVFKDGKPAFEAKPKQKYNLGNLFKNFPKDEALKIKTIVAAAEDPQKALKDAGYDDYKIEQIMAIIAN
jgi:hypothetical protein